MSYALRNTLLLLGVLILIVGGGFSYIYFYQMSEIDKLEKELDARTKVLNEKQKIAEQYEPKLKIYEEASAEYENFDKALMPGSNPEKVFDFLRTLNTNAAYTILNFSLRDSSQHGNYGIVSSSITGSGNYAYLYNFIRYIEHSKPINRILNLEISPINEVEKYAEVNFTFTLDTYYKRNSEIERTEVERRRPPSNLTRNPFYPLIRQPNPNTENLVNVQNSTLIAVTPSSVFVRDQNGRLVNIGIGEKVYLGSLKRLNIKEKTATFELNVGGLLETVTLGIDEEEGEDEETEN